MANFDPHISKTVQPILTKLVTQNYLPKTTRHARPHIAVSTWVAWAKFCHCKFFPRLSFFLSFLVPSARPGRMLDRFPPKSLRKRGSGVSYQGVLINISGARIGISSQMCKKIQIAIIFKTMHRISIKFDGLMQPKAKTSWVVLYVYATIPIWRTDFDFGQ